MPKVDRRDFLKLAGAGVGGAGLGLLFSQARLPAAQLLIPQPLMPEEYSPGVATWYNTACRQCPAGCGISVRTREGRAKKIEGNPLHPVSQGGSCSLGQAGLHVLYNPDRLTTPLMRNGEPGASDFYPVDWNEALERVSRRLSELRNAGQSTGIHLLSGAERGHLDRLFAQFMQQLGAGDYLQYEFDHPAGLYAANKRCFAVDNLPCYDIGDADFLISFGADYLGTWLSPVQYGRAYGHMRRGRPGRRGRFVQIEARMSLSGANADEWLPALPGSEGVVALALAGFLVREGRYRGPDAADWAAALAPFTLEHAASRAGIDADRISALAEGFAGARNVLAIGGGAAAHTVNGTANMVAVNILNYLAGSIGRNSLLRFNPPSPFGGNGTARMAGYERLQQLLGAAREGRVQALIVHGTNPAYALPDAAGFREAVRQIPLVIALSPFMDETTALADVVLPTHSYLESWGDDVPEPGPGFSVATLQQPVVQPLYDTLGPGDIVLELARRLGLDLPWADTADFLRSTWREVYARYRNANDPMDFDEFWRTALQSGVWGLSDVATEIFTPQLQPGLLNEFEFDPAPESTAGDTFTLQPFASQALYDGRGANLPWLQELSDPITGIAYGTWVELNPDTAADLGVREGDVLELSSAHGSLLAPAFVYPAIRPDVIGVPIGQGHTAYGRYAQNRGANPLRILSPLLDRGSGALAWAATRVKVRKTRQRVRLVKTSGEPRELGRGILGPPD